MYSIPDTYDFSESFMYINGQWDSIHKSFVDYVNDGFELVRQKELELVESLKKWEQDYPESNGDMETEERISMAYFETMFLNAGLMFIFSKFEYYLGRIEESTRDLLLDSKKKSKFCRIINSLNHRKKKKSKNNVIARRKDEILKMSSLRKEFEGKYRNKWDKIIDYQKIRNYLTHANGTFNKKTLADRFSKKYPDLTIIKQNNKTVDVYLSKESLIQIEEVMTILLKGLMELIYESSKTRKQRRY